GRTSLGLSLSRTARRVELFLLAGVTFLLSLLSSAVDSRPPYSLSMSESDIHIVLTTQRLTIRQFTEDDVDNLLSLNSDPEVMRDEIIPFHLDVYSRLDRLGTWAAESADSGEFLGWFHLRPGPDGDITNVELGYRLRRATWNRGYATEGSRALIDMGFTELS